MEVIVHPETNGRVKWKNLETEEDVSSKGLSSKVFWGYYLRPIQDGREKSQ